MPETVEIIDNNNDQFSEANSSKFVGRVYGYTAIGILITTFVCAILTFLFTNVFSVLENDLYINIYLGILIGSAVCLFGVSIWANMTAVFKKGKSVVIPFIIYAILMGILMSSLTMFVPGYIIAITLGITTLTFGSMFMIGHFTKRNLSTLAIVASGLACGALMIIFFNLILFWWFPEFFNLTTWLASGIIFISMMLFTIVDVNRVKQIAMSGVNNPNVALLCAFNLYIDFIYMFIRILRIVIVLFTNSKK